MVNPISKRRFTTRRREDSGFYLEIDAHRIEGANDRQGSLSLTILPLLVHEVHSRVVAWLIVR